MARRKFCKTVIQVTVLSEGPFEYESLNDIYYAITEGDCSGEVKTVKANYISGRQMAKELIAQGSSPEFLQLTNSGRTI
jgi:hypothetical protein